MAGVSAKRGADGTEGLPDAVEEDAVEASIDPGSELLDKALIASGEQTTFEHGVLDADAVPLADMGNAGEPSYTVDGRRVDVIGHEDVHRHIGSMYGG